MSVTKSLISGIAALTIIPLDVSAQVQSEPSLPDDEVVVVGSRYPTPKEQLGNAVTVLDEAFISARGSFLVSDLLRTVPGIAISRNGPVGSLTQARIRGAEGNHTLVLIDGVQANDPGLSNEFNLAHLMTDGVERIEILRGPQSALYGGEAIGGVINIITKSGRGGPSGNAWIEAGSFGTVRLGAFGGGGSETLNGSASVAWLDSTGTDASPIGEEKDGYSNLTLNGRAIYRPTENLSFSASARYTDNKVQSDTQDFNFLSPTFGQIIDADESSESKQFYGGLQGALILFDGKWRHDLNVTRTDLNNDFLSDGAVTRTLDSRQTRVIYQSSLLLEARQSSHRITGGVEYEDTDFDHFAPDPADALNQTASNDQVSVVGEYRADFAEQFYFGASIRHDDNDFFQDATTWSLSGAWILEEGRRLHSSVGRAITNPDFFELFGFIPGSFVPNPDLMAERSFTFDVGLEQKFLDNRLIVDTTYFNADLKNEISTAFEFIDNQFLASPFNKEGSSKRHGIEINATATVNERFSLYSSYTYTNAKEPRDDQGERSREIRRAKHIASLGGTLTLFEGKGRLNFGLDYNGKQLDTDFSSFPATNVTLGGFLLASVNGTYQVNDQLQAWFRVENLFDENYQQVLGFAQPGIGAFAGLRLSLSGE